MSYSSPTPEAALKGQDAAEAANAHKKKHRTFGNHVYDWGIYGSVAWLGVAAMSLLSAHEANHGTSKYFNWWRSTNNAFTKGMSRLFSKIVKPENVKGYAEGTSNFLTLGMGGMLLMIPLKWMEDNRQKNASRIDNLLGTTPQDPETIAAEPKQTWKSVLSGRFMSWGISYAAFLAMTPKIASKLSKGTGEKFTQVWMALRPQSNPAKVREWADLGAFDSLYTIITASLTFAFSRFVAKRSDPSLHPEKHEHASVEAAPARNTTEPEISHAGCLRARPARHRDAAPAHAAFADYAQPAAEREPRSL